MPTKIPHPADDPLVAELLDSPVIHKFVRLQFLRGAAALLDQATTVLNPSQKAKLDRLYKAVLGLAEDEAEAREAHFADRAAHPIPCPR